jgi:hypothetical protein
VQDRAVTKRPLANKEVLQPTTGHIILWPADECRHRDITICFCCFQQTIGKLPAKDAGNPLPPLIGGWQIMNLPPVVGQ